METIKVCAWCYPKDSIFLRFPHWAGLGLEVSHGICPDCKGRLLRGLDRTRDALEPVAPMPSPGKGLKVPLLPIVSDSEPTRSVP